MSSLRFLVDVNIGVAVADSLRDSGHDVTFAGDVDWRLPDRDMLSLAHGEQRIILTMDTDFGDLVYHSQQPHAGVLLLRMPGANRDTKVQVVQEIVNRYGDQLPSHFCVYRQGRLRIRP
jgi:predicted nuclease of predicted toxin-antitoxin system